MIIKRHIAAIIALTACQAPIEPPAPQPPVLDPSRSTLEADRTSGVLANGGDAVVVTVTLRDQNGDPMPNLLVSLEVEGEGTAIIQPPFSDAEGVARGVLRSTRQGVKTVKALVGSVPPIELAQRATVEFGSGPAVQVTFATQPTSTVAGAALSPAIEVVVQDVFGSPVTSSTMEITLSLAGGRPGAPLDGTTTTTVVAGVATFDDLVIPLAGTGYRLVAQADGLEPVESASFDVAVGPAAALVFATQPSDHVAGGSMNPPVSIHLLDARGNRVVHPSVPIALMLRSPPGQTGILGGETRVDSVNGVATFNDLLMVNAGEGYTLVAVATGLPLEESAAFKVTAAAPYESMSLLTADAAEVLADGVASTTLSLRISDGYGNRIAGRQVTLDVSGSNNLLSPDSGVTDTNGEFIATLASPVAESKVVTASFDTFDLTTAVKFVPGAPSLGRSSFAAASSSVVADGVTTTALTVRVVDESDNPIEGALVTFSVSGSEHTLTAENEATGADGVLFATLASTRAEAKTITASFATHNLTQVVVFHPGAPSATTSTLQASPPAAIANGVETCTLTLVAKDAAGNPIAGQAVSLLVTGTNNTLSAESGLTDTGGEFHSTLASTRAEAKTVTATFENLSLTTTVVFLPGAASLENSTFEAEPASLVADGIAVTTLTVRIRDEFDNPRPDEPVKFSVTGSGNTLVAGGPTTGKGGEVTATLSSARAESKTVTATFESGNLTQHVSFVPGAPSEALSSLTVDPTSLVADGVASATITVRVVDDLENPIVGEPVTLIVSGSENTLDPASGRSDEEGLFVSHLASTYAEVKSITATFGDRSLTEPITFDPIPPDAHTSTVAVGPTQLRADGEETATISVTVRDQDGRPLSDRAVLLSISGEGNHFSQPEPTDSAGAASTTLRATRAGIKIVTAMVEGVTLADQPEIVFDPAYRFKGKVSGITGTGLRVRLTHGIGEPGFDELSIEENGEIEFPSRVADGVEYQVTVQDQPSDKKCIIENGEGVVGDGDVDDIWVRCGSLWKQIAHSSMHALGIKQDGTLWAWGRNDYGQIGDGTNIPRSRPVLIGTGFKSVAAGAISSMALKNNGTVWVWGDRVYQNTDGTTPDPRVPHMISGTYSQIASGDSHRFALGTDGRLWGWGYNSFGQVGDGTDVFYRDRPVLVGSGYVAISAGHDFSMAMKSGGALWGWGSNRYGRVGAGSTSTVLAPKHLGDGYIRVYAGRESTHAIRGGGTVWAWGRNQFGQLGDGTTTDRNTPTQISERFTTVIAGDSHTIALKEDGSLWSWGQNTYGQLGDGTFTLRTHPTQIGEGFASIDVSKDSSFAIKSDGTAWVWGSNEGGKFGDGTGWRPTPVQVGSGYTSVAAGEAHSLGIKTDGTLWAWGSNTRGQLGIGALASKGTPQLVGDGFVSAWAGYTHSVAIKEDGSLWTWGGNTYGQLGDGTTTDTSVPVEIGQFTTATAGSLHTIGIKADGSAWSWGSNTGRQLGDGTGSHRNLPYYIGGGFLEISAGSFHSIGMQAHGSILGWGNSAFGALGNGSTESLSVPTPIGFDASMVSTGSEFTVAIKPDGTLWSWGRNSSGQIGNGTLTNTLTPYPIGAGYLSVEAGYDFAFATREDGTLVGWGSNLYGQLGNGPMATRPLPIDIGDGFAKVSAGGRHTLAVKDDGSLWAWGDNSFGAVGDGHGASSVPLFVE